MEKRVKDGFAWSLILQFSTQFLNFAISVFLARLLIPADFGIIGIVAIFINIGRALLDGGLASSLIRTRDCTDLDYSTVFFLNIFLSFIFCGLLIVSAPFIADYFNNQDLKDYIKVYSITFIFSGVSIVHSVILNKQLRIKEQFYLQLPSLGISAFVAIYMAMNGYGVWSLIAKELTYSVLATIQLWYYSNWRPKLIFGFNTLKSHWKFGSKILYTDVLSGMFNEVYKVIIAKFFNPHQLGLYTRAKSLEELPSGIIFNALNRVMYPYLSEFQTDSVKIKEVYRTLIFLLSFIIFPLFSILILIAKPLIIILLTEKWSETIPLFQLLVFSGFFVPFSLYMNNILKIKGRSDLVLKLSIFGYTLIFISVFPILYFKSMHILLYVLLANAFVKTIIACYVGGRLINYSLLEQLSDVKMNFVLSVLALAITYFVSILMGIESMWVSMLTLLSIFLFLYALLYFFFGERSKLKNLIAIRNS